MKMCWVIMLNMLKAFIFELEQSPLALARWSIQDWSLDIISSWEMLIMSRIALT